MKIQPLVRGLGLVALGSAVCLLVVVSYQTRSLRDENHRIRDLAFSAYPGMYVPELSVPDVEGREVKVGSPRPGQLQILFFLKVDCEYSLTSLEEWERAQVKISSLGHDAVGIVFDSLASSQSFAREHRLGFPLVPLPNERVAGTFRISGVPMTLVINEQGRVAYSRRGEFTSAATDSLIVLVESLSGESDVQWDRSSAPPRPTLSVKWRLT